MNNNFNYNKTLTFYGYSNVNVVKLLSSFYFCNKLFLLILEKKDNLLFNSLFVIKNGKVIDYVCNLINQQFSFELSPILDGNFFSKNLKSFLFYTGSSMDELGNQTNVIVRSDFDFINNSISHKCELRFNFNNVVDYDKNISNPFVFSYKNKYYLLATSKNFQDGTATLLLFGLSEFLNNPKLIKEINIKNIYETIDSYHLKQIDDNFVLFVTATFKKRSEKDPNNGQITFYSVIDDIDNFIDNSKNVYHLNNFGKLDVADNYLYPLTYSANNVNYLLGIIASKNHNNLINSPKVMMLEKNKIKLSIHEAVRQAIGKIFDNKVLFREVYLEEDNRIELLDDKKLLFTIGYDGFDLKIIDHLALSNKNESFILVNKEKCNLKILVDTNILEIYIDNAYVYSKIIEVNTKILMHKNFVVKI